MEIIAIIASLSGLFIAGANAAFFIIVKFNDLKHVEERLVDIQRNITMIWEKLDKTSERVASLEGRFKEKDN
jgi:hypothetical protein